MMTTGTLAVIIYIAIFTQLAGLLLLALYRYRRRSAAVNISPTQQTHTSITQAPAPGPAWQGFREFIIQRRIIEDTNHDVCSFYLVPVDGNPLPSYRPGQFLTFTLPIEDPQSHETKNIIRCYSLSDSPAPDHYRVSIKRIPAPPAHPELPAGLSSSFFHDQLHVGSRLLIRAPAGQFHLMDDEPLPVVLVAGGIGITPMLSILNTMLQAKSEREIWLYYGIRNGKEQIMKQHLAALASKHDNFHLHLCYSDPDSNDIEGVDFQHRGQINIPLLRSTLKFMRYQFYVCGPKPMMESIVPGLEEWGVKHEDIYYESFGPATLIRHTTPVPGVEKKTSESITITFSKSGKQLHWDPNAGSLLEFAESQGIEVTSGCRAGSCGSCQTRLEAGNIEYKQQPDADIESGYCLLCISTPSSDLTLAA